MSREMTPIQIIGLKSHLQTTVRALRAFGCVHIEDLAGLPEISAHALTLDQETARAQEELSLLLARINGLLDALNGPISQKPLPLPDNYIDEARAGVDELAPYLKDLLSQKEKLEAELASLPRFETTLRKLLPILPSSAQKAGNRSIGILVSRDHIDVLDHISKRALELTHGQADVVSTDIDSSTRAMLIVFPEAFTQEIETTLGRENISRLRLPEELGDGSPDTALETLYHRMTAIPTEIAEINQKVAALSEQWSKKLSAWRAALQDEVEASSVFLKFGETDTSFILAGWVPTDQFEALKTMLHDIPAGSAFVEILTLTPELKKRAPVVLQNPTIAKPFESLINMLALPRYGHVDPTRLMAFFLPLFFGMILGDVGYGTLALLISLGLLRRFKEGMTRDILLVLAMGSTWAILFGFLFGEAFGTLGEQLGLHPLWFDRANPSNVMGLLLMTIGIGAAHITLGLVIGVWEAIKDKSRSHLLERGGMLLGLIGLFLLVSILANLMPQGFKTISIAFVIVGVVMLGASLGSLGIIMGPIEFLTLIGNILSYLRIAAIGLASVFLAKVANEMAGLVGNVVVGVILAVLIHALNLTLGMFSPTIHSLRLHYVEFFRKFYEGGGRRYEPFKSLL